MSIPMAKRGPCKWHDYVCHRQPPPGKKLCAYHAPMARVRRQADIHASSTDPLHDWAFERLAASYYDGGCDCDECLRN